jgi:hypothetical protein
MKNKAECKRVEHNLCRAVTVTPLPAKLLIRSPLGPDCEFELRVERDPTSEEWDALFDYLQVCRRAADREKEHADAR